MYDKALALRLAKVRAKNNFSVPDFREWCEKNIRTGASFEVLRKLSFLGRKELENPGSWDRLVRHAKSRNAIANGRYRRRNKEYLAKLEAAAAKHGIIVER